MSKRAFVLFLFIVGLASSAQSQYFSVSYTASQGSLTKMTTLGTEADQVNFCSFDNSTNPSTCASLPESQRYDNTTTDQHYQILRPVLGMVRFGAGGQFYLFDDTFALRLGLNAGLLNLNANNGKTYLDGNSLLYGGEVELALEKGILQVVGFYPYVKHSQITTPTFTSILTGTNESGQYRVTRSDTTYSGTTTAFGGSFIVDVGPYNKFHIELFKELSQGTLKMDPYEFPTKNYNIGFSLKFSSKH